MKNKYRKFINGRLSIGVCIITVVILGLLISGCSNQLKSRNNVTTESTTTKSIPQIKESTTTNSNPEITEPTTTNSSPEITESTTTKSSPEIKEVGPVPTWVKWNNKTYKVKEETVTSVGEKLGVSESTSLSNVQRDIYSIPNVSSDKEIAIEQLGKTYFKAVINK
jgi:hypothetical protein